jgi:hypothetical protein
VFGYVYAKFICAIASLPQPPQQKVFSMATMRDGESLPDFRRSSSRSCAAAVIPDLSAALSGIERASCMTYVQIQRQ